MVIDHRKLGLLLWAVMTVTVAQAADDWPMWRYDAARTASSPHALAPELHLQWVRELAEPRRAWPPQQDDLDRLEFDVSHQPIVHRDIVIVTKASSDSVLALDIADGAERWRFFGEGPFRLAAAAGDGRVYAASDDGFLYCLDVETGALLWKFRGGVNGRRFLGNERLINMWPARGGPVLKDGIVYFGAGLFPFMGTFLHALDAESGTVIWSNSNSGSLYTPQIHMHRGAFSGTTPQGYLTLHGDTLFVACGRSRPAIHRRATGEFVHLEQIVNRHRFGGFEVMAGPEYYYVRGEIMRTSDGSRADWPGRHGASILGPEGVFGIVDDDQLICYMPGPADEMEEVVNRWGEKEQRARYEAVLRFKTQAPRHLQQLHLQAGNQLYGSGEGGHLVALSLSDGSKGVSPLWEKQIDGTVWTMAAASGRLLVMTEEGHLYVFGAEPPATPLVHRREHTPLPVWEDHRARWIEATLAQRPMLSGFVLVAGIHDGRFVEELVRQSDYKVVVVDPDSERVNAMRARWNRAGIYGARVAIINTSLAEARLPPYFAEFIVSERPEALDVSREAGDVQALFSSLRPYGGFARLALDATARSAVRLQLESDSFAGAKWDEEGDYLVLRRTGPLPGAGSWTHQNADTMNTGISAEQIAGPLGVLWFGGPSNEEILPKHGRGPIPHVIGGRVFILGPDTLFARDVYTGRPLWSKEIPGIGAYYNTTRHQPGADHLGAPYVSLDDGIYVAIESDIIRLDPGTGEEIGRISAPRNRETGERLHWGYMGIRGNLLIAGLDPLIFSDAVPGGHNWNAISSRQVIVLDRYSGEVLWRRSANLGFRHNAIVAANGRLFLVDRLPDEVRGAMERRGETEPDPVLMALDIQTGEVLWETVENVHGSGLNYSKEHDVLVQAGRQARTSRQRLEGETTRISGFRGADGSLLWSRRDLGSTHLGKPLIHKDSILITFQALCLLTGENQVRRHPITDADIPWSYRATRNCSQMIGSENLVTFRRGTGSYMDLSQQTGPISLGGFRVGCTPNMVPADGVLNIPDYTRGCVCSYQLQTSMALIPMNWVDAWTVENRIPRISEPARQGGINFGAPGERHADGLLWVAFPKAEELGGFSAEVPLFRSGADRVSPIVIPLRIQPDHPEWTRFQKYPALVEAGAPWVAASGIEGEITLELDLATEADLDETRRYTIQLYFLEPEADVEAGERVFHVSLQGEQVIRELDLVREAGGPYRESVHKFSGVSIPGTLEIQLSASANSKRPPVISGVEFLLEEE